MKIANIELTGEKLLVASGVAALAAVIAVYSIFYMPLIKKLRVAYRECRLYETQVSDARRLIEHEGKVGGDALIMEDRIHWTVREMTNLFEKTIPNIMELK